MKRKVLIMGLLAAYAACALSNDRSTPAVAPPPLIKVLVRDVEVRGVCLASHESYLVYSQPRATGYSALTTRAVNNAQVYAQTPVRTENCADTATAWPDVAVGYVRAAVSASGVPHAQLVIAARSLDQCTLQVDLPLRDPNGGSCAPVSPGRWAYCGCPEIYTDFKAP
jgi:hypothetical protein